MPLDWYPKWSSQLHTSFVSYQSGSLWQRKFAPPDQISASCAYEVSSDILDAGSPRIAQPNRDPVPSQAEIIILEMYNSGSNLFYKLLNANIEKPLNIELCKNYSGWGYCGRVWKHTHPRRISEAIRLRPDYGDFNQTVALVLVRHPFALIHSIQAGENYDVRCGEPNELPTGKSIDIKKRCSYVPPTGSALQSQMGNERIKDPICPIYGRVCWGSVAEGWNSYVKGYLYSLNDMFKQVKIIRYEDLVLAPERTMRNLGLEDGLNWDWKPLEVAAKQLGGNRADALRKLAEKNYGANYTNDELQFLCRKLDKHLMGRLGYHGCKPDWNEEKGWVGRAIS
jgi:hypothetical protein